MSFLPGALRSARRRPVLTAGLVAGAVALAGSVTAASASAQPTTSTADSAARARTARDVQANLFEWNWPSVATECTAVLGPSGYGGVQVAPPQDSLRRTATGDGSDAVLHPWWEVYQPTDYSLTSRMGTEQQFKDMVDTCRRAGVQVYVDAVLNHMTGQGTTSYGGRTFTKYDYPGVYSAADFHSHPQDCPLPPAAGSADRAGSIADFNDYRQVFTCELVGLSDLDTGSAKVQETLAAYLNTLLSYGVSGFRVDAAKHIGQADLAALESRLRRTVDGTRPTLALEVMPDSPGRLAPAAFEPVGKLLGFDYAYQLQAAFQSYDAPPNDGNIGDLQVFGEQAGLLPSDKSLVFVENHDTERNGSTLSYKQPSNTIANEFMLAYPYGTPQVYASFAWASPDDSPPAGADGRVTDTACDSTAWVCVDRDPGVRAMVGFHNRVGNAPVANWFDDGTNLIAFSRGSRGFFATNSSPAAKTVTVRTGMAPGTYCDVISSTTAATDAQSASGRCGSSSAVVVGHDGTATLTVPGYGSVAFTAADRRR
jgi:alpha-amylase